MHNFCIKKDNPCSNVDYLRVHKRGIYKNMNKYDSTL